MKQYFKEESKISEFGRTGRLETRAGSILTPTFMPDGTRGVVKSLLADQVKATGAQAVLANTYHLHLSPGESTISELGGLHEFGKWRGPILTDSGGFQVFSLGKHTKITEAGVHFTDPSTGDKHFITPESSMQIQIALGSDMIVAFDHLIGLAKTSDKDVLEAFERTHRWLERCVVEYERLTKDVEPSKRPILFGVVQGGLNKDLRRKSLELVQNSRVGGIAIGGLSVGETKEEMYSILEFLAPLYDNSGRPRFLLGVGDPPDIRFAVEHGIDMLDCVLPTRNARHATVWVEDDRKIHLTNGKYAKDPSVIMDGCDCFSCTSGYSKAFFRHQFKAGEPLAGSLASIHNLRYLSRICEVYRK